MRTVTKVLTLSLMLAGVSQNAVAQDGNASGKALDGFPAARNEVLTLIGGATQRIRVVTDFLSDGEIVSALYIAQYRKVNVQVLLGQGRATHTLSRLNYLKSQNIPVWIRPRGFMSQNPTILLVDQKLYALNGELDYMAKHRKFTLTQLPDTQIGGFESGFDQAASTGLSPTPRAVPLVGRAGAIPRDKAARRRGQSADDAAPLVNKGHEDANTPSGSVNAQGVYRYNRVKVKPQAGVPTKLPKTTILQERASEAKDEEATSGGGTVQ